MTTSAFTVDGTTTGGGGEGTVTQVTGTVNQITVTSPTTTPVISFDPAFVAEFQALQAGSSGNGTASTNRNYLINGSGLFAQRGASGAAVFTLPNAITRYVDDCWAIQTNGTPVSVSQVMGPDNIPATGIQIQRTPNSSVVTPVNYGQTVVPEITVSLIDNELVFNFAAQKLADFTGTLTAQIIGGTSSQGAAVSYLGTGFASSSVLATETLNLTTSFQNFTLTIPQVLAAAYTQVYVGFTWTPSGQAGALDGFVVAKRQLSTSPQTYAYPDYFDEYRACLIFYRKTLDLNVDPATATPSSPGYIYLNAFSFYNYAPSDGSSTQIVVPSTNYFGFGLPMYFAPTVNVLTNANPTSQTSIVSVNSQGLTIMNTNNNHQVHLTLDATPV
jgi:hypothetical protein